MPERKAAAMLAEEIEKRTQLRLKVQTEPAAGAAFVLGRAGQIPVARLAGEPDKAEGFTLRSSAAGAAPVAVVTGHDDRGVVFGTGYLLRQLDMGRQRLELAADLNVTEAPAVAVRGHQLGYRPKTNAYDAWGVARWEQYIRELAIFGINTIELIPPRSDDAADSPHFPLPQMEMMVEMSRIADEYGLDVSIWYPAMDADYSDPKTVEFALEEWGEVFRRLPRIDAVFVPGGDPGHTEPKYMMALLEKQTANLRRYHPKAQMWMSPQGFTKAWMDEFLDLMKAEPAWLAGVVFGPQQMYGVAELRQRIPQRYPIRFYPDITHSIHSQYPVPDWDAAFALTEGREGINPRPLGEAAIFRSGAPSTRSGSSATRKAATMTSTNSSGAGWAGIRVPSRGDILRDYAKFFIGDGVADAFAEGLLALERNWSGPLISNTAVDTTLLQFQELERTATPQMRANWRFQEALYRAYYDAFLRDRLLSETEQENRALGELIAGAAARGAGGHAGGRSGARCGLAHAARARAAGARVRAGRSAVSEHRDAAERAALPGDCGGARRQPGRHRLRVERPRWLEDRFAEIRAAAAEPERLRRDRRHPELDQSGAGRILRRPGRPAPAAAPGARRGLRARPRVPPFRARRVRRAAAGRRLANVVVHARGSRSSMSRCACAIRGLIRRPLTGFAWCTRATRRACPSGW